MVGVLFVFFLKESYLLRNFFKAVLKDRSHYPMQTLLSKSITARPQKFTIQRAKKTFAAQIFSPPHTKTSTDIPAPLPAQLRHPSMAAGQRLLGRMSAALPPVVPMCLLTDRAGAAEGTRRTRGPRSPGHPGRAPTARLPAPVRCSPRGPAGMTSALTAGRGAGPGREK